MPKAKECVTALETPLRAVSQLQEVLQILTE